MTKAILMSTEQECNVLKHGVRYEFRYNEHDDCFVWSGGKWQEVPSTCLDFVNEVNAWDFVEQHYPDYHNRQDIAYSSDLSLIVEGGFDEDSEAHRLYSEWLKDNTHEGVLEIAKAELNRVDLEIYQQAIENYMLRKSDVEFGWSMPDVYSTADKEGVEISPNEARQVLRMMEQFHDANEGMNWGVINGLIDMVIQER